MTPATELLAAPLTPIGAPLSGVKSQSGRLAQSDPEVLGRIDAEPMAVIVKLDYDALASYAGGLAGLTATSPEATGLPLDPDRPSVQAYVAHVAEIEASTRAEIRRRIPEATFGLSFRVAYGGFAMQLPANRIEDLLTVDGVVAIQVDGLEQPLTDASPAFIGAPAAWDEIGTPSTAGAGVVVGVLDTGIWPEHPSFADPGVAHPGGLFACEFGGAGLGDAFVCNDKLIGAHAFLDTYLSVEDPLPGEFCNAAGTACSARDANGHGTHTASTAAGSPVASALLYGVDRGPLSGVAPGAHVIAYRVCLDLGCFQSDSVAAVEQAILDGVDVINFSISGGSEPYADAVELAFLDAYAAGIVVNASAGNEGPEPGTANHAGPWTITVGASTSNRHLLTALELQGGGGAELSLPGASVTTGVEAPTSVVLAEEVPGYDDPDCTSPLPPSSANGQVVACRRGVVARVAKGANVAAGGGAGMILYNPALQGLDTDNHVVSTVHIDQPASDDLLAFLADHSDATASWASGTPTPVVGDIMAPFSSRGPVGTFLKPDVTAPGVQILAGTTPEPVGEAASQPGELFQAIAGTSMSSPHAAGVSALVRAAHPGWSPGRVKSALMTSSVQGVLAEDGLTPATPHDRGAGSIRADRALHPTFTFEVDASDFYTSSSDPLGHPHLNLPSIAVAALPGTIVTTRTIRNVSGAPQTVRVTATGPAGARINALPGIFELAAGATQEVNIGIDLSALPDGTYFGELVFEASGTALVPAAMPVAVTRTSPVQVENTCDPGPAGIGAEVDCMAQIVNFASVPAPAELSIVAPRHRRVTLDDPSAPASLLGNAVVWSGNVPASGPPLVTGIEPGGSPFGYLPLSSLGVPSIAGIGDETLANFATPEYLFGGETYDVLAVTSNGYVVVGGGALEDLSDVPQALPSPSRPNNVLAPYWTDLNPSAGGAVRIAIVSDGPASWIVADWDDMPVFGSPSTTNDFQVWIEVGPGEGAHFTYNQLEGHHAGGLTVGAENRTGSSGATLGTAPVAGDDFSVGTSPSGTSVTITYHATASVAGAHALTATLRSPLMAGADVSQATLEVE